MSEAANNIFEGFEELFNDLGNPATSAEAEQGVTAQPVAVANSSVEIENTNNSNLVPGAQAKLTMIKRELNDLFMERDNVIDCMLYALVSGQSLLMLGNPGTARVDINA